ncbi:Zn-binding Pro-Ala-Ala-Arg (PAAR) domain-containing protein, incolved in TypeVI secretion [Dyella jiangningensis]|uniref:PAAR domain-containing protein n=1 Tax=Dyella sp. AtDHG13 TaxID=1938897 RepID=UPI00088C2446|nr:PAAR domain-containing protein [Dyella sp. AtDHG13]PXV61563.1 putative Zn-binding protein involved in type VI secretion [Dyella sp. AtDHG13]SDJ71359.1 Zn-binding Pro-Ala-Ala-Arg (PAAR) domain-containing protein, incolved in TypeVI secretion [Dyella jiangningensis]
MPSPVVLVGHAHACPIHGRGHVTTGTKSGLVHGKEVACAGDKTSCGATIIGGSPGASILGKAIARKGDTTDHGGVLEEGDASCLVP